MCVCVNVGRSVSDPNVYTYINTYLDRTFGSASDVHYIHLDRIRMHIHLEDFPNPIWIQIKCIYIWIYIWIGSKYLCIYIYIHISILPYAPT